MAQLIPGGQVEPANWPPVILRSQGGSQPQPLADSEVRNMQQHVKIKNQRLRDQKNLILNSQETKTLKNFDVSGSKKVQETRFWRLRGQKSLIVCMHIMHNMHACIICMHVMHAYYACMHIMHPCILCIHAYYACMHIMHASILCMHAYYACMHIIYAHCACMHITHACILACALCIYAYHACMHLMHA